MRWILVNTIVIGIIFSGGCGKKAAPVVGQQATVTLKDGSGFAGAVKDSSTASITLVAPNGEARTYPMSQVATIQYSPSQSESTSTSPASAAAPTAAPDQSAPNNPPPSAIAPPNATSTAPQPETYNAPPPARAPLAVVSTVPAGTRLTVRNNETIDSKTASPGQTYAGVVVRNVVDTGGQVVIPRGSNATLIVRSVNEQGRIQGQSELALDIDTVSIGGRRYRVETTDIVEKGRSGVGENKRTAKFVGGGAVLGTLLGAVAGGGRGAAIGALSGAAAGTATQAVTRGHGVRVPAETLMTFRLEAPIRIREIR